MPAIYRLIAVLSLTLLASALCAQQKGDSVRVDTIHDTVFDTTVDTFMLADTTDRYYQLAEKAIDFKKSMIDSLLSAFGVVVAVLGVLVAVGLWLMQRSREMSAKLSREEQELVRAEVDRSRVEIDRLLSSARSKVGSISTLLQDTQEAARAKPKPESEAPGFVQKVDTASKTETGLDQKDAGSLTQLAMSWQNKIDQITESDAEKAVDLYERLRFEMSVHSVQESELPSSLRSNMAENYYRLERYEKALEEITAYATQTPLNHRAFSNWGLVLAGMFKSTGNMEWFDRAIEKYKHALEIKPDFPEASYNWGLAYFHKYDSEDSIDSQRWLERAIEKFEQAIRINPKYVWAFNNLGLSLIGMYHETNNTRFLEQALEAFNKTLELDPTENKSYFGIAMVYSLMGRKDEMLEALKTATTGDGKFKKMARENKEFEEYRDDKGFRALVGEKVDEAEQGVTGGEDGFPPSRE